ncbi:hypothetical protein [Haloferax chudinovii]|uniref:Glycosyltransferase RgtA/B/C/D-like domain-containing protein n=1 Tax=Haloferax chudinovii TaxID=1109010 RepID=A0ABD5XMZ4_9EURY
MTIFGLCKQSARGTIALVISVAVGYRVYQFTYPASLIGMDPDKVAVAVQRLIDYGFQSAISELPFYAEMAGFHVYAAMFGMVSGLDGHDAIVIMPVMIGVTLPLFIALIARSIATSERGLATVLGAGLASVGTISIHYATAPIPQTLATGAFVVFVYSTMRFQATERKEYFPILMLSLFLLAYSHKLGVLVAILGLIIGWVISHIQNQIDRTVSWQPLSSTPLLLATIALSFQWVFVSNFGVYVMLEPVRALLHSPDPAFLDQVVPTAAVDPTPGIGWGLATRVNQLVLLGCAAIAGFVYLFAKSTINRSQLLGFVAGSSLLVPIGVASSSTPGLIRIMLIGEPVLLALIAVAIAGLFRHNLPSRTVTNAGIAAILVLIVTSQVAVPAATPDHPLSSRHYLTEGEVVAKQFAYDNTETTTPIHVDYYYAREIVDFDRDGLTYTTGGNAAFPDGFSPVSNPIVMGGYPEKQYNYTLIRPGHKTYRTGVGIYRILYSLGNEFDATRGQSKVYNNGDGALYTSPLG